MDMKKNIKDKNVLLSYNGKSFDYPLIRNRFILNRIENPFEKYSHLDLLHSTRRLYKNSLPSCSLGSIEKQIFSFSRWKDIDGSMIPQSYFTFIQTGYLSDIQRIIDHNQQDIISLARLLFHLHHLENNESDVGYSEQDLISMFNIAVNISDLGRIKPLINAFAKDYKDLPAQSLKKYSLLLKKQRKWIQALEIWKRFIAKGEEILFSCEEVAKYYEHQEKNFDHALDYTNRAIDFLNIVEEVYSDKEYIEYRERFNRRLYRLQYKLTRKNQ